MSEAGIKTTVVGSYPVPVWLSAMPTLPNLRDAVLVVLKTQELAGIDVIADGELSRFDINHPQTNGMIDYFVTAMAGIDDALTRRERADFFADHDMGFRTQPAGVVRGAVAEGKLDLPAAWSFVHNLSSHPLKFTLTSPYMLAKTLLDRHYGALDTLAMSIAEVLRRQVAEIDAPVVQIDEAHLTGHPRDAGWAAEPINHVLDAVQGTRALHLCFGNYGGQTIQKGLWRDLLSFLNGLHVDHLILECARRGYNELTIFRDLRPDIALGVGVIDIKDNGVESADTVAERIEGAVRILGEERVRWVHPDCGFWMLPRTVADAKMSALVAGRDLYEGR